MQITLNNRPETIDKEEISIKELLDIKNFTFKMMVIKINDKLIRKGNYEEALIHNNDNVEIIHMISGG